MQHVCHIRLMCLSFMPLPPYFECIWPRVMRTTLFTRTYAINIGQHSYETTECEPSASFCVCQYEWESRNAFNVRNFPGSGFAEAQPFLSAVTQAIFVDLHLVEYIRTCRFQYGLELCIHIKHHINYHKVSAKLCCLGYRSFVCD